MQHWFVSGTGMLHGIPSSSFTNDRHKQEDEEDGKRELVQVLFLGAIKDQNVGISLLPAGWEMRPE